MLTLLLLFCCCACMNYGILARQLLSRVGNKTIIMEQCVLSTSLGIVSCFYLFNLCFVIIFFCSLTLLTHCTYHLGVILGSSSFGFLISQKVHRKYNPRLHMQDGRIHHLISHHVILQATIRLLVYLVTLSNCDLTRKYDRNNWMNSFLLVWICTMYEGYKSLRKPTCAKCTNHSCYMYTIQLCPNLASCAPNGQDPVQVITHRSSHHELHAF